MKFTKSFIKKTLKETLSENTDNTSVYRSMYGVVPDFDGFGDTKVKSTLSFSNEGAIRKFCFKNAQRDNALPYFLKLSKSLETHFKTFDDNPIGEHCLVLSLGLNEEDEVEERVFLNQNDVSEYFEALENRIVLVVHFLPFEAREIYHQVHTDGHDIAYSNTFSFKNYNFVARLHLNTGRLFNGVVTKTKDEYLITIRDQLRRKYGTDGVEAVVKDHPLSGGTMIEGFNIYFNKISEVNYLKLIKLDMDKPVQIKASLKSIGMTKDDSCEK